MFNNPFSMVVAIVAIVSIASIVRARLGLGRDRYRPASASTDADRAEIQKLREEVRSLKERVAVLERLAIDSSRSLDREIEQLRREG